jgi:hypothetical protein
VFVHIAGLKRSNVDHLREGEKVTFDVVDNRGKPAADVCGCDDGALKAPRPLGSSSHSMICAVARGVAPHIISRHFPVYGSDGWPLRRIFG